MKPQRGCRGQTTLILRSRLAMQGTNNVNTAFTLSHVYSLTSAECQIVIKFQLHDIKKKGSTINNSLCTTKNHYGILSLKLILKKSVTTISPYHFVTHWCTAIEMRIRSTTVS